MLCCYLRFKKQIHTKSFKMQTTRWWLCLNGNTVLLKNKQTTKKLLTMSVATVKIEKEYLRNGKKLLLTVKNQ